MLRMSGLDPFNGNSKPEPPDREFGEVEQGIGRSEGHTIVRADGGGKPAFPEQLFKGLNGSFFAHGLERLTHQKIARGMIRDGEGIVIAPVTNRELPREVGTSLSTACPPPTVVKTAKSLTYVPGKQCHLCVRPFKG